MLTSELVHEVASAPKLLRLTRAYVELIGRRHPRFVVDHHLLLEYCHLCGCRTDYKQLREVILALQYKLKVIDCHGQAAGGKVYRLNPRLYGGNEITEEQFLETLELHPINRHIGYQALLLQPKVTLTDTVGQDDATKPKKVRKKTQGRGNSNWIVLNGIGGRFKR